MSVPERGRKGATVQERFMRFVRKQADGCWLWDGCLSQTGGYGHFRLDGRSQRAHIVSYRMHVGEVPAGLELDHICRTRACVNPNHLRAVTRAENMKNTAWGDQTHCKRGHPLSGSNLYANHRTRSCVCCARERARLRSLRLKAA
jgi:hypothetical protein